MSPRPAEPGPGGTAEPNEPRVDEPQPTNPSGASFQKLQPTLSVLNRPPYPGGIQSLMPLYLEADPEGQFQALFYAVQQNAVMIWPTAAPAEVRSTGPVGYLSAWSPRGLYVVKSLNGDTPAAELWLLPRSGAPERIFAANDLDGIPGAVLWDQQSGRLLLADRKGWRTADQESLRLPGPWGEGAQQGSTAAPDARRYITYLDSRLILAAPSDPSRVELGVLPAHSLKRVSWSTDGEMAAVEVEPRPTGPSEIHVYAVPRQGKPRELLRVKGRDPVLLAGHLHYLLDNTVFRLAVASGTKVEVNVSDIYALNGDTFRNRLFLFQRPAPGKQHQILYMDVCQPQCP